MTPQALLELPGVPRIVGTPLYQNGAPLEPEQILYNDKNLREIYFNRVEENNRNVPHNSDEEEILKNYVIYHIHAPVFRSEYLEQFLDSDLKSMSLDDLIFECMDYGIDPF